jgi:hypothetical protein
MQLPPQPPPPPIKPVFGYKPLGEVPGEGEEIEPPNVTDLRAQFSNFVALKADEIAEAKVGIEYYHGKQFSSRQLKDFYARRQAPIVFNRIRPKINSIVGVLKKMRGDPKAFGRNAPDERGAELATQCVRYALDACRWNVQESEALTIGSCHGIVIAELGLCPGDKGDPDPDVAAVDPRTFFYDPRSLRQDLSDARFMGTSKFVTQDEFEELFPPETPDPKGGMEPSAWDTALGAGGGDDSQTEFEYDKQYLWSQGKKKVRLVEHWYRTRGEWRYCFYAGSRILDYGVSPFYDEKGKTISRFIAFTVAIDEEGTHYGFVRHLKGPQDTMNFAKMKMAWIAAARQLKVGRATLGGDGQDIETKRTEAARADGVLIWEVDPNEIEVITQDQEFLKQAQFYADAKQEIEGFGPNPALAGSQGAPADISGRSLAMQQQASLSELGPFLENWNGWRLRIYRAIWIAQQRNWMAERWLRISRDPEMAQYVAINQMHVDEWGRPITVNAIGNLDVEILMDEGPNSVNVMGDSFDLMSALALKGMPIPPPALIELSPLPRSEKDKLNALMNQPDPAKQAMQQATIDKTKSEAAQNMASAQKSQADAQRLSSMTIPDAQLSHATAVHKLSLAHHETQKAHGTQTDTALDMLNALNPPQQGEVAASAPAGPPGGPPAGAEAPAGQEVTPAAGPPPVPGGPPVRAPDGHFYVHAPHPGGRYQRVLIRP